jgi:3-deoxy-D-manno-octulosonic-acid transferase
MHESTGQRLSRGLYSLATRIALPFSLYYLIWRGLRQREYFDRWSERFAFYQGPGLHGCVWLHAVSVGEVNAAVPLVAALRRRHPELPLLVTTTTPTGSARVRAVWGEAVTHVYLPYDLPGAVRNFLAHFRPRLAVVMETEIWPNLYAGLAQRAIPLVIANARLSKRSLRGYRPFRAVIRAALSTVACIAAQSEADAGRYRLLGAPADVIEVTGNLKYDVAVSDAVSDTARQWRQAWGVRPVWIAASTHAGEEDAVIAAHRAVLAAHPDALLLWAPRHPERFSGVIGASERAGFRVRSRRNAGQPATNTQVFVIDTLGELLSFYAAADLAFVGGSLEDIGGHNLLEPVAFGVPAIVGPHTHNFAEITALLLEVGAAVRIAAAAGLAPAVIAWIEQPEQRRAHGEAGRARIASERGALGRTLALIEPRLLPVG